MRCASVVLTLFALASLSQAADGGKAERPNIIVIMADDMGYSDLGCYGSEIATPNLDRLAGDGLRFTRFYNTARCCPTRASLLTGLYPHQVGMGCMVGDHGLPAYQGYLNDRCVTIAEALKPGGYRTFIAGKWHVGEEHPTWPADRGFDKGFGLISGACSYFKLNPGRIMFLDNERFTPSGDDFFMTDAITDHALSYIEEARGKESPFFLYVAYTAPHFPLHAKLADIAKYKGKYMTGWDTLRKQRYARMRELGVIDDGCPLTPRDPDVPAWDDVADKETMDLKMAVYAAQIDNMDQNIGRLLGKLKTMGIEDNTVVMFLADNGGASAEIDAGRPGAPAGSPDSYLTYGKGWANASNTPFRLFKRWVHEGGISSPLIVRWPRVIKQGGKITKHAGHVIDLMATCVDLGGVAYPSNYEGRPILPLEGKSLRPVFEGRPAEGHEALFWEHEGHQAIRAGSYKLVSREQGQWELYDIDKDRSELHNLIDEQPETARKLKAQYDDWARRCGVVPFDTLPKASDVVPWYRLPLPERTKLMKW